MWNHKILLFHLPEGNLLGNTDYDMVGTFVQQAFLNSFCCSSDSENIGLTLQPMHVQSWSPPVGIQPALCARSSSRSWPWASDICPDSSRVCAEQEVGKEQVGRQRSAQSDVSQENEAFYDEGLGGSSICYRLKKDLFKVVTHGQRPK